MNDNVPQAAQAEDPNHPVQRAKQAQLEIYRLGMMHAAFLLRGSDLPTVRNDEMDECAGLIEFEARQTYAIRDWPVDATD